MQNNMPELELDKMMKYAYDINYINTLEIRAEYGGYYGEYRKNLKKMIKYREQKLKRRMSKHDRDIINDILYNEGFLESCRSIKPKWAYDHLYFCYDDQDTEEYINSMESE